MRVHTYINKVAAELLTENAELQDFLERIVSAYRGASSQPIELSGKGSERLRSVLREAFSSWKTNVLVERGFPSSLPSSNVEIEFQNEIIQQSGERLFSNVEVLGDNRQALGTNLLKLELANIHFGKYGKSIAIGISLEKDLKKAGWDNATGTFDEYEHALISTYSSFIKSGFVLVGVGL